MIDASFPMSDSISPCFFNFFSADISRQISETNLFNNSSWGQLSSLNHVTELSGCFSDTELATLLTISLVGGFKHVFFSNIFLQIWDA